MIDCTGKHTKRYKLYYGMNNIDISNISNGVYTALIINENKIVKTFKLIIQ
ncbi:MAG: hypothetical protein IJV31_09490 [Clostridia bacterium]|nr:hypothetical protein [Clostridia bacterium]